MRPPHCYFLVPSACRSRIKKWPATGSSLTQRSPLPCHPAQCSSIELHNLAHLRAGARPISALVHLPVILTDDMAAVAPLVVIAPAYCTPSETGYVLQGKGCILAGYFDITDTNGVPTFKLQRRVLSLQHKKVLLDMAGNPVAVIRMKKIYAGDGDTLLASVKRKLLTMKFQANVIVHRFGDEPYLKVKAGSQGPFLSKNLKVQRVETVAATVSRKNWLGPPRYDLVVSANVDQAFCVALTIVLDVIFND